MMDEKSKGLDMAFAAEILLSIFVWYSSSAVANTTSRKLLTQVPLPLLLTLSQFVTATIFGFVCLHVLKLKPVLDVPPAARGNLMKLTIVYTLGFIFVNAGYVVVNVSLAETLRSAEPLVTVMLAIFVLKTEPVSKFELWSMAPIVVGGALSSLGDSSFSGLGLLFVCISNLSFSLRSMYAKKLKAEFGDAFNQFYRVSLMGTMFLVVLVVVLEVLMTMGESFMAAMSDGGVASSAQKSYTLSSNMETIMTAEMFQLALLNGCTYVMYNQTSFYVLSRVRMVTHGVANAFRRVVTILFSVWYFGNHISTINAFGISLAVAGVVFYAKAKDDAKSKADGKIKEDNVAMQAR
ncbi:Triose phosphate/phosphate translocator, chloroplastic [Hondaea fermentalgiana]|uniref:Triose phosphate/phosphate translocator, chloroplastic n=1 Tax=Hondaea fermentalgiana TaxID=2315210 RepID=A0A2R5GKK5_9STRA|nr:Triose phosphate/phosphate translocator, chloroplastic [Hondaea fermentalgiana]|eukprot:GBG30849.1 Triose phosphate/phosphate translocator, chloroplastic [Hondaea fermentalgiana]